MVDARGMDLHVLVHPVHVHDRRVAEAALTDPASRYPKVGCLFADMGYQGLATSLSTAFG